MCRDSAGGLDDPNHSFLFREDLVQATLFRARVLLESVQVLNAFPALPPQWNIIGGHINDQGPWGSKDRVYQEPPVLHTGCCTGCLPILRVPNLLCRLCVHGATGVGVHLSQRRRGVIEYLFGSLISVYRSPTHPHEGRHDSDAIRDARPDIYFPQVVKSYRCDLLWFCVDPERSSNFASPVPVCRPHLGGI